MIELFSVLDAAASRFIDPFAAVTMDVAIRGFKKACETPESPFHQFPEDFSLHHVGEFNPETGEITGMLAHKIAMATSFVQAAPQFELPMEEL